MAASEGHVIPVYVNTFNRLTTTRSLCDQIAKLDNARPVIIDNASDWGPLQAWYTDCPYEVVRLRENIGHHAPWLSGIVEQDSAPYYVVTDCDLDIDGVPADCLSVLMEPFSWRNMHVVKSGLSLRIDDLPQWQSSVRNWEARWWKRTVPGGRFFWAAIDTTFAMYRGSTPHNQARSVVQALSVRSAQPYTARHVPWYLDGDNLDEENRHYFATANASNSWRPNGKGLVAPYLGGRHASRRV